MMDDIPKDPGDFDILLPSDYEQDDSPEPSLTIGVVLDTLKKVKDGKNEMGQVWIIVYHHPLSQLTLQA